MEALDTAAVTALLTEPFPDDQVDRKNGKAYIPHELVRDRVITATGNCFDWSIEQVYFRDDGVTRRTDRATGGAKRPWSMVVIGTLMIPGLGRRSGIGAHPLDEGAGEDAAYKSAESDAFKRAAMAFGVGLQQLYINKPSAPRPRPERSTSVRPTSQRPPEPISDDVFEVQVQQAMTSRDGEAFRRLAEVAGSSERRWSVLIAESNSVAALDWVARQLERRRLLSGPMVEAIDQRRTSLVA
jgi:hypothetical protein